MIHCPRCGAGSKVTDSRPSRGTLRRRRQCEECTHRWHTMEIDHETYALILEAERAHVVVGKAARALQDIERRLKAKRNDAALEHAALDAKQNSRTGT